MRQRIRELPAPVTASKADWLPGTTWIGFTPQGRGPGADAQCASTVQRQMGNGYVLERITQSFGEPNAAFQNHPRVAEERIEHDRLRDRLIAVHKLRHSMRPLREIVGPAEFDLIQDMWSADAERKRWSVAFPIVGTYEIVGRPRAKDVFPQSVFDRLYRTQSATLRVLDDEARSHLRDLEIERKDAPSAWIAIEDEFWMAERSELSSELEKAIARDLRGAMEGETEERKSKLKKRAAWLANQFASMRRKSGTLRCDSCKFDPKGASHLSNISPRSFFDVHHKNPLAEGKRYTTVDDFALLCPTCHRIEHLLIRAGGRS